MVPKLGVNLDFNNTGDFPERASGRPDPEDLALFEWVRLVPRTTPGFADYVATLRLAQLRVLLVLDKNALGGESAHWAERAAEWATTLSADCWQIGNEPDAEPLQRGEVASWIMEPLLYRQLLEACLPEIRLRDPGARVITAGLCGGDPGYLGRFGWPDVRARLDGIAVHPYGQQPSPPPFPHGFPEDRNQRPGFAKFGTVDNLLGNYAAHLGPGQALWISEFGDPALDLPTEYHRRMFETAAVGRDDVAAAFVYCWSDRMGRGFGLVSSDGNDKPTYQALQVLGGPAEPERPAIILPSHGAYEANAWGPVFRAARFLRGPTGDFEGVAWAPVHGAAAFLAGTGDAADARAAHDLRAILGASKLFHGAQESAPDGPLDDAAASERLLRCLTTSKTRHGAQ
jgi:hypothetical protein